MLTKKDLLEIEGLIDRKLEEKLEEKLSYLPTKEEFYKAMDRIMKELQEMREDFALTAPKVSEHETRITNLEEIHPNNKHIFV